MFVLVALIGGSGCGGSDDDGGATDTTSEPTTPPDDSGSDGVDTTVPVEDGDDGGSGGDGTATLTLADETSYEFEMSTCDTSDSAPDVFEVDPGYDLFGTNDDGWQLSLIRAGFDEESASPVGGLEIDDVSYAALGDDLSLEVDGSSVTGTALMSSLDPGAPLGSDVEVTVEVSC